MDGQAQGTANPVLTPADNPFLKGNFRPVSEELTVGELEVHGSLPREIAGRLLRTTPNPIDPGDDHHWFLGDAMLHGVVIEDGKARGYRNRYVRTPRVEELTGRPAAPKRGVELLAQGSGNVNVIGHAGRVLALPEVGLPWEMTPELDTLGLYDFGGRLASNMTAHPKIDPANGELVFFGYDFGDVHLRYHVADASGALVYSEEIATPLPTMMHDFGVTATRVIFMDFPVAFDLAMIEQGKQLPFRWRDDLGARLGVMPRRGKSADVVWIDIDPCYVYHPLNAYDDGARIVFDVVRHERTFVEGAVTLSGPPALERWTIDPAARRVDRQLIDELGQEFPRVSPRVECHRHRFGYGVRTHSGDDGGLVFGNLLKYDLATGHTFTHDVGAGCAASEGVFVPVGAGEDEGYLIAPVYDSSTNRSHIRVVDATDFEGPPVARIELPVRIPFGFHGNFIAG